MPKLAIFILLVAALQPGAAEQDASAVLGPIPHVYATPGGTELTLHEFRLPDAPPESLAAAIVFFHGGGWTMGEAAWAFPHARRFAEQGMISFAAQYRLSDQDSITPLEAMADARAAIRWVRAHAESLGVDPGRIAAYGWSAGGHLAASAATFGDSLAGAASPRPDALVLVSPAVSLRSDRWVEKLLHGRAGPADISPDEHAGGGFPPTLILHGDADTVTPLAGAERFRDRLRAQGATCELHVYRGFGHLFTPAGIRDDGMPQSDSATSQDATRRAIRFLTSLGFID